MPVTTKMVLALTAALIVVAFTLIVFAITAKAADNDVPCLSKEQARAKWPKAWLYWHGSSRCWDNQKATRAPANVHYSVNRNPLRLPKPALDASGNAVHHSGLPLVVTVSEDEFNDIDAQADKGPSIFYPTLMPSAPTLILTPELMTKGPILIDIDLQQVFTPWEFRIAGVFGR